MKENSQFSSFRDHLRTVGTDAHPRLEAWMLWLESCENCPSESELHAWAGAWSEQTAAMGRDVWDVLAAKVKAPCRSAITSALRLGGGPLVRTSRAWFDLVRDCGGTTANRKFKLYGQIANPEKCASGKMWL